MRRGGNALGMECGGLYTVRILTPILPGGGSSMEHMTRKWLPSTFCSAPPESVRLGALSCRVAVVQVKEMGYGESVVII